MRHCSFDMVLALIRYVDNNLHNAEVQELPLALPAIKAPLDTDGIACSTDRFRHADT